MLFTIFNIFLTNEEIKTENKIYITLIGGSIFYLCIIIFIKNIIYHFHISENIYWIVLIIFMLDLTMYINQHKEFIEKKIKEFIPNNKKINIPVLPPINIDEIKDNDLEKEFIDEIKEDEYTCVIV